MTDATTTLPTPPHCIADFCLIPIGTSSASVSEQIADVQRLLLKCCSSSSGSGGRTASGGDTGGGSNGQQGDESNVHGNRSGLVSVSMHSAGTTVEGSWDAVMKVIGQAHMLVHSKGVVRIQSDVRVGTRTDKVQSIGDKVAVVEKLLSKDAGGEEDVKPKGS